MPRPLRSALRGPPLLASITNEPQGIGEGRVSVSKISPSITQDVDPDERPKLMIWAKPEERDTSNRTLSLASSDFDN